VEQLTDGAIRLGPGTLYRSLQRMRVDGLIEELDDAGPVDDRLAERRRSYRIGEAGWDAARRGPPTRQMTRRTTMLVELVVGATTARTGGLVCCAAPAPVPSPPWPLARPRQRAHPRPDRPVPVAPGRPARTDRSVVC
jgi:hypothetical protein